MRFLCALVAALLLGGALPARAARIAGQVIAPKGKLEAPVSVLLYAFDQSGGLGNANEVKTDAEGNFAFGDLAAPGVYWLSMRHLGITYPGQGVKFDRNEQSITRTVNLSLFEHTAEGPALSILDMEVAIEPEDAGVFRFEHQIFLENPEQVVISHKPDTTPVLRLGLAPEAEQPQVQLYPFLPVDFAEKDKVLEIYGPVFPKEQMFEMAYRVNGDENGLQTEIVLAQPVEQLRVLLPPTQFSFDFPTLKPGPTDMDPQTKALRYQTFVGFKLKAGDRIPVRLLRRTTPTPPSTAQTVLMITLLFGVAAFAVLQPVISERKDLAPAPDGSGTAENEALFVALRDLEEDFELGKLSREDRDRMRQELRSEALRDMARARQASKTAAETSARRCACGFEPERDARFCSSCGRKIA